MCLCTHARVDDRTCPKVELGIPLIVIIFVAIRIIIIVVVIVVVLIVTPIAVRTLCPGFHSLLNHIWVDVGMLRVETGCVMRMFVF